MSFAVGPAANTSPSEHPGDERQHSSSPRYHPYQRLFSHRRSPTSLAKLGDLGVARPNEDPLEYAARLVTRGGKDEESEVICPPLSSPINPITYLSYQEPGCATKFDTFALLTSSPLPFANYGPSISSFVFAASIVSEVNVGPQFLVQPGRSSPPPPPIEIPTNVQARIERTDREILAQKINEHLETNAEPIIGSIDNPFPLADQYGIKGVSVLSVFFHHLDMRDFTCHFCGDQRATIDDALGHQRVARHYNE